VTTARHAAPELLLHGRLQAYSKFRSPIISSLLALAILLGKAIVCQHAPGRVVFFDAMLMIPVSMLAFNEGLATGLVAGVVTSAIDVVMSAKMASLLIPVYLSSASIRSAFIARLFSFEVVAAIVALMSCKTRRQMVEVERRTEKYLKKIHLLEEHTEAIQRDARDKQAEFKKSLFKYSSLVYLLEESAQKIYSSLDIERLFQSLFRVLEECFGASCASIYLKDTRNGSFFLATASGADNPSGDAIPMMVRPDDFHIAELIRTRRAIRWTDEAYTGQFDAAHQRLPAVMSGMLVDKGDVVGVVNVHTVDREDPPDARLMGMVCNIASIAFANARLFGEVQWMAERDPLTKLYNRRTFHQRLDAEVAGAGEQSGQFSLLMLDIDHFKAFNDTYGHQAGDAVLEWFAQHCQEWAGEGNPVFRYGGEEFTVIMPGADTEAGQYLAEKIRRRIADTSFQYDGHELKVMLSCGVAVYPDNGSGADELVRKADRALYKAKDAGRNAVVVSETGPGHDTAIVPYQVKVAGSPKSGAVVETSAGPTPGREPPVL